jgi:hypothetical protein
MAQTLDVRLRHEFAGKRFILLSPLRPAGESAVRGRHCLRNAVDPPRFGQLVDPRARPSQVHDGVRGDGTPDAMNGARNRERCDNEHNRRRVCDWRSDGSEGS